MIESVLKRVLRAVFGGGGVVDIDLPTEFATLVLALKTAMEMAIDTGEATGGSNTTLIDTNKSWETNMWVDATFEVKIGTKGYMGVVLSNTATTITFTALPGAAAVVSGCKYGLKRPVDIADISDRAARLLGVVYGSQAQQLLQRATTFDLLMQLRHAGAEIDPRAIRALTATDIVTVQDFAKLIPIAKAAVFNIALPAAEADILGADITPTNSPSYLRIYVCVAASGIFRVAREVGGVTVDENLNGGTALAADAAYMFTVPWRTGDAINFEYSVTGANILRLLVDEIGGAE